MAIVVTKVYAKDRPTFARLKALPTEELLNTPVKEVPFCNRVQHVLEKHKIETLGALQSKTHAQLLRMRGMGRTSIKQIDAYLSELGITPQWPVILPSSETPVVSEADSREQALDARERELEEREARLEALLEEVDALLRRTEGVE